MKMKQNQQQERGEYFKIKIRLECVLANFGLLNKLYDKLLC